MGTVRSFLVTVALFLPAVASAEEGWFGFSQRVEVSWLLNVESAVVNFVAKGSPADEAGILVNDSFVSIEGCAIPGCGAYKAQDLMTKAVGETLSLKLKRPSGEEYSVALVAKRQPETASGPQPALPADAPPARR